MSVRVLLVQHDPGLQGTIERVLRREGYEVATVAGAEEAVHEAGARPYDLLVADVQTPDVDRITGFVRLSQRAPEGGGHLVCGFSLDEGTSGRLDSGEYVEKPFDLNRFLAVVRRQLDARTRERVRLSTERGLRAIAVWALQGLGRILDGSGALEPRIRRAEELAVMLATHLELRADIREDVRLATLVRAVEDELDNRFDPRSAPPTVQRILDGSLAIARTSRPTSTMATTDSPMPARVVALALEAAAVTGSPLGAAVDAACPNRWEPYLLGALDQGTAPLESAAERAASNPRALLSLGRTFVEVGNVEAARHAFEQILATVPGTRAAVEALIELARLTSEPAEIRDHALDAVDAAQRLGPASHAGALLEAGLLLRRTEDAAASATETEGRMLLRQAAELYDATRLMPGRALSRLALATAETPIETHLERLWSPEHLDALARSASWLFPLVAARQAVRPHPSVERVLRFLVRECPQAVARSISSGALVPSARATVVDACQAEGLDPLRVAPSLGDDSDAAVQRAARSAARPSAQPRRPLVRIHSLGPFEVFVGESRVTEWRTQKSKYILAWLAAQHGRPVTEEVLIDLFWPNDVDKGKRNLYSATSVLRRLLRGDGDHVGETIARNLGMLSLDPDLPRWHDVEELEKNGAEASQLSAAGRTDEMLDRYRAMAQLYTGPYLDGCFMDWALDYRTRLERRMIEVFFALADDARRRDRPQEALELAARVLDIDPCRQDAHLLIMQAATSLGRMEEAIRQYERCRRLLEQELGLEPSIALVEAWQRARLNLGGGLIG